ncbi:hypothetical protein Psch_03808 [Pelotomaculum schinkii]|uniref:Uncharacterized protein n=1 Tax=Pelotomaculum schinkii TaxID=78350 RepID=A0A4Y7R7U4_9FIRM|nr:hypothetical protein Psch_03808 [Pelotomaculum schinkii]
MDSALFHELAELAPCDIVVRAILKEMAITGLMKNYIFCDNIII